MTRRRLVVNVDHVATLRQARRGAHPDPVTAAQLALLGGADGIVVHLREDRRHVQDRDARLLRETVHGHFVLEMAATQEMLKIALELRPEAVTLVPERREELTTERGLDVQSQIASVGEIVRALRDTNIESTLFVDPVPDQIKVCHRIGGRAVEIHTGRYAEAGPQREADLRDIAECARLAHKLGLRVGVGHGLDYRNVEPLAQLPEVTEFSIGHSIVSRAVLVGMERAVREMRDLLA